MGILQKKRAIFLINAVLLSVSLFAQNMREQGLLTLDPYWRQALGGAVLSLPSVQAQSTVVALDGGNIKAYSTSGTPMWNYSARGRISPYVSRSPEGTSYLSRTTGVLIAVNRSGRELWRRDIGGPLVSKVIVGWDGRLFAPIEKALLCLTASGNLLWTKTFESSFASPPRLDHEGGVIFTLENNQVYKVDAFGKTSVWTPSGEPAALISTERRGTLVLFSDGTMEILGSAEDWFISAAGDSHSSVLPNLPASPIAAASRGNDAVIVLSNGKVALISMDERKIAWEGDTHMLEHSKSGGKPDMEVEAIFDERGIYILSKDGASGFSRDGARLWFLLLKNAAAIPAFCDDGVLYSGGKDWILYSYKVEDRYPPRESGIYGPRPEGSYGTGVPQSIYAPAFPFHEIEIRSMLERIDSAVFEGKVGENEPAWTTFLLNLSSRRDNAWNRVSALYLLGQIGSRETIPALVNIFRADSEPLVKAAAASAIGSIGVDPDGIAMRTFLYAITPGNSLDERTQIALVTAIGDLCRFSGPPLSEAGIRILNILCENSQMSSVRQMAQRELVSLW